MARHGKTGTRYANVGDVAREELQANSQHLPEIWWHQGWRCWKIAGFGTITWKMLFRSLGAWGPWGLGALGLRCFWKMRLVRNTFYKDSSSIWFWSAGACRSVLQHVQTALYIVYCCILCLSFCCMLLDFAKVCKALEGELGQLGATTPRCGTNGLSQLLDLVASLIILW